MVAIEKWIVSLLLGCFAVVASAAEPDALIKAIEAKYKDVNAMQADFKQTTHNELFGDEQHSGEVTLKRPSMMRWNFTHDKQFVTDGKTMWIYTRADNQVIKYDDISVSASSADALLQSLDKLSELFEVEVEVSSELQHTLVLRPKEENSQLKKMRMRLSASYIVERVEITDAFDNVTDLEFTDVKLNPVVPDSVFKFTIPEGAEVITAGSM